MWAHSYPESSRVEVSPSLCLDHPITKPAAPANMGVMSQTVIHTAIKLDCVTVYDAGQQAVVYFLSGDGEYIGRPELLGSLWLAVMNYMNYNSCEHSEARTKWQSVCRQHFQMHFCEIFFFIYQNVIEVCDHGFSWLVASIGSDNGLVLMAPSHYLNQCWLLTNWICGIHLRAIPNVSWYQSIRNYIFKVIATSPRGPWVKAILSYLCWPFHSICVVWFSGETCELCVESVSYIQF